MKSAIILGLSALVVVGFSIDARADNVPGGGVGAQGGAGKVTVSGSAPGQRGSGRPGTADPVGSLKFVPCGPGAEQRFRQAGDVDAAGDAASCSQWLQQCYSSSKNSPTPSVATLRLRKGADGQWAYNGSICIVPAKPVVTADAVRAQVVRMIPVAAVGLAPKASTLVNIQTVMWVAAPASRNLPVVQILGQRVVIHLTMDHVAWAFGDRSADENGPVGKAYDEATDPCRTRLCPNYFGHVYAHTGRVTVSATVQWDATFTVDGGGVQRIPGTVSGPAGSARLTVRQARAVLVPNP